MKISSSDVRKAITNIPTNVQKSVGSVLSRISKALIKTPVSIDTEFNSSHPIRSNVRKLGCLTDIQEHSKMESLSPRLGAHHSSASAQLQENAETVPSSHNFAAVPDDIDIPHLSTFGADSKISLSSQLSKANGYTHLKPSLGGGKTPITGMVGVYDLKNTGVVFKRDTASAILSAQRFGNLADAFEIPNARLEVINNSSDLLDALPNHSKLKGLKKDVQNLIDNHPDKSHVRGKGIIEIKCLLIEKIEGEEVLRKCGDKSFFSQPSIQQQLGKIFVFDKMVGCEDRFPGNPSNLILTSDNKLVCIDSSTSFNVDEDEGGSELNLQALVQQSSRMANGNFLTDTLKNFSKCEGFDPSVFIKSVHETADNFIMHLDAGNFNAAFAKTDPQGIPSFDIEMMHDMASLLKSNR